ncbi:MAG: HAD family hydrolase [Myxococcota bacterium]
MVAWTAWIFDLDGTLTVPMHDFAGLKAELGLPADRDVLAGIATRPEAERDGLRAAVRAWEREHIAEARAAEGAAELLASLGARGCRLGVLTRNTRSTALDTLERIGLGRVFTPDDVLGRDSAPPKPHPGGVLALVGRWGASPGHTVMVGDWVHDLEAGRSAGAAAVWIDHHGSGRFAAQADRVVRSLRELM